jgi:hypothetical protein
MDWIKDFQKAGYWELNNTYKSQKVLSHLNLSGINFVIDKKHSNTRNIVYLFKTEKEVFYIGETSLGMQKRFEMYRYGFDKLNDTDNRVKIEITNLLTQREEVEIYFIEPKAHFQFNGVPLELAVSKSFEEYLIAKYQPRINKKENKSLNI